MSVKNAIHNLASNDIFIVGAGIAGLSIGLDLLKLKRMQRLPTQFKHSNIILLERYGRAGGRVDTRIVKDDAGRDTGVLVEAGAGRISNLHSHVMTLLKQYDLEKHLLPIKKGARVIYTNPVFQTSPYTEQSYSYYLNRLLRVASLSTHGVLSNHSMREFFLSMFTETELEHFITQYGYHGDILGSNAYVGMKMLYDDYKTTQYYSLQGGLNQIVDSMLADFEQQGGIYRDREAYESIRRLSKPSDDLTNFELVTSKKIQGSNQRRSIINKAGAVFFAASPTNLEKRPFSPIITEMNRYLYPMKLLRIYSVYKQPQPWLKNIDKVITDEPVQFIIPISDRVIMISYTDSENAEMWNTMYEKSKEACIEAIHDQIEAIYGIRPTPPDVFQVEYWKNGVFYWREGVNIMDDDVYHTILHPEKGIYVANEGYSRRQGWMEGAVEMAKDAVTCFVEKHRT